MNTKVYTSYYGNYKNIPAEYQCISVSNSKPEGICVPKWKEVVPGWDLVQRYKSKQMNYADFVYYYLMQLSVVPMSHIHAYLSRFDSVCLLCYEKDPATCHRNALAAHLASYPFIDYCGEI